VTERYADGDDYDALYRDTAGSGGPPWVIGGPQPALAEVLDDGVKGPKVLDIGCGTVFVLAVSLEAGQGWGVTEELLWAGFAEPEWVDMEVEEIDVAAETDGRELFCAASCSGRSEHSTPSPDVTELEPA
jgi:hypothetical protein